MSNRPITRISLPSHHPIVAGMKKGGSVRLHAVMADDTEDDVQPGPPGGGPRPMPLTRDFHVMDIARGKPAPVSGEREPSEDQKDAVRYLKNRQSIPKTGGRSVS